MSKKRSLVKGGLIGVSVILIMMLCFSFAFAQQNYDSGNPSLVTVEMYDPMLEKMVEVQLHPLEAEALRVSKEQQQQQQRKREESVIAFYGNKIDFASEADRLKAVNGLFREISDALELRPELLYPEGPVVSYGERIEGHFFVGLLKNTPVDPEVMNEIYTSYQIAGEKLGLSNVPVEFRAEDLPELTRTLKRRPVFGGLQVADNRGLSTLGFAAWRGTTKGIVVSGHHFKFLNGYCYQPTVSSSNLIGKVARVGGTKADASWVPFSDVSPKVYISSSYSRTFIDWSDPYVGLYVYKSGISTGVTGGQVVARALANNPEFWMENQWAAEYSATTGDSGSPVYSIPSSPANSALVRGIHWGTGGGYSLFSPVSGVYSDLGAWPMVQEQSLLGTMTQ